MPVVVLSVICSCVFLEPPTRAKLGLVVTRLCPSLSKPTPSIIDLPFFGGFRQATATEIFRSTHCQRLAILFRRKFQQEWHGAFGPILRAWIRRRGTTEATAQHVGGDDPGVQRNSAEAVRQFLRERLRESFDGPFRGAIWRDFRVSRADRKST